MSYRTVFKRSISTPQSNVIRNCGKSSTYQDRTHFDWSQAHSEKMVEYGTHTWNVREFKKKVEEQVIIGHSPYEEQYRVLYP